MKRWFWRAAAVVVLAVVAWPAWLAFQVWEQSRRDELGRADAIVVLGAAQYQGEPSPVLRARLNHASYLYHEGFSDKIVVTGGKRIGDLYTEAEAGRRYLELEGVPPQDILHESEGRSSLQSLRNVARIADDAGIHSVLLVSDPLHSERIKRMASDLGFTETYSSPASYVDLNRTRGRKAQELLREVGSLISYELLDR